MCIYRHVVLTCFGKYNQDIQHLYQIFSGTLNKSLTYEEFHDYYFRQRPHYMDITFIQNGTETTGFICVTFYKQQIGNKTYTICRGAIGIKEEHRGGQLPCWQLFRKYIRYKLAHPLETMYITGYIANPLVYSMICKHASTVYPKAGIPVPGSIHRLREQIVENHGLQENVVAPFVLKIHFQVQLAAKDVQRIYESRDEHVRFYLDQNPDFQKQVGILTLVPVNWFNILVSTVRTLVVKPVKKWIKEKSGTGDTVVVPIPAYYGRENRA